VIVSDNLLGSEIKRIRERAGRSIPDVADAAGIERTYLYKIENQEYDWLNRPLDGGPPRQPSRDLVIRIAWVLGMTLDECDELLLLAGYAPLALARRVDKLLSDRVSSFRDQLPDVPRATGKRTRRA
jgi:transcriptional regulator with XRE-family HTH domain